MDANSITFYQLQPLLFQLENCSGNAIDFSDTEVQKLGVNDGVKLVLNPSINKV